MRLVLKILFVWIALVGTFRAPIARADDPSSAPEVGFYSLELRHLMDPSFDPKSVPALHYWYREVDPTVKEMKYGIVPAAANRLGTFIKGKIVVRGDENTLPAERFKLVSSWKIEKKKGGIAELLVVDGERILRLYGETKDHPLADFALIRLGLDQRAAAEALHLDPTKFPRTMYLAHRGVARVPLLNERGVFPGNTLEAMAHALWNGYPGFEIDIQMTKDKVLVVSHDEKLGVSTDCTGKISERLLSEIAKCRVNYTGVVPDVKLFHNKALISSRIPTLRETLDTYLPMASVQHIVLDVKPGKIEDQTAAFLEILGHYPVDQVNKIIFLMRSTKMIHDLQDRDGAADPIYAREQSKGWEDLEKAAQNRSSKEIFSDTEQEEVDVTLTAEELRASENGSVDPGLIPLPGHEVALSLSLGLGLGISGLSDHHKGSTLLAVFQILKSIPKAFARLVEHRFGNGSVDIDILSWSKRNEAALKKLTAAAEVENKKIVGWTVNTKNKIGWLRLNSPSLDFILSDLPYRRIVALQLEELSSAL